MLDSIQSLLDAFPEGVVQVRAGIVLGANEAARRYLSQLNPGSALPLAISLPEAGKTETGIFVLGAKTYTYSCKASGEEHVLLFCPESQSALENWQLDGVLRQLRNLLGEILAEVGPATAVPGEGVAADTFGKTFHRLFRLISNLEFMQQTTEEGGVPFQPVTMDLDGLCRDTAQLAGDLLREAGVTLEYRFKGRRSGLLIPGDPKLLQRMLLGLISNAARAAGEGKVTLTLLRSGDWARIMVVNSGPTPDDRHLSALFQGGAGLPLPGQGAGLGLPIARHIAQLHGGTLLPYGGGSAPGVLVSLPAGLLNGQTSVRSPSAVQWDGGLDPVLVELSDVLPAHLFGMEGLD